MVPTSHTLHRGVPAAAAWLLLFLAVFLPACAQAAAPRPNIIVILADDLGYGDLGSYGQRKIQTPRLDRMAAEGLRFNQFYAGSTVCAPSRCVLMTGRHTGHATVRGNGGAQAQRLQDADVTLAEVLRDAGYATALIGKWGLGMPGDEGLPTRQGFEYFFGFLSQVHAHNHYPSYLWRNETRVSLPNGVVAVGKDGAGYATNAVAYADDLFAEEALAYITTHRQQPFFLFMSLVVPHANNERHQALGNGQEVPDFGPYAGLDWPEPLKGTAAMITRMDSYVGRILDRLKELGMDQRTLVLFTSDNGPHKEGGNQPDFFGSSGPHRGIKRDFTDGGIRVPCLAWWPGRIAAGRVSAHVGYFGDVMATACELAGARIPRGLDSLSFAPELRGDTQAQRSHPHLYWEFHEGGFSQAVLIEGRWKGIRMKRRDAAIVLYDLQGDPGETRDLAAARPDLVARARRLMETERTDSPLWPPKDAAVPAGR